jgi:integrase/recombinase XerD
MSPEVASAHITPQSTLYPTIIAWQIYLEDQGNSVHTVKAFTNDLRLLASYLPPDRTLGSISTSDLDGFLEWMQSTRNVPCSPKTLARRITSIKAFFRWLHKNGVLLVDPAEKVIQKTVMSPLPEVLTEKEVKAVSKIAESYRHSRKPDTRYAALFELLIHTGIKKGECLALSPDHIDFEAPDGPILFVRYTSPQHRYKERKIALPQSWISAYQDYVSQYQPQERIFPWSQRRLEYLLEDLGEEAGLTKHLSFDMCRWTCALLDWKSGMERDKIRQKMGISKVQWREIGMKLESLAASY